MLCFKGIALQISPAWLPIMYKIINSSKHLRVPLPFPGILKSSIKPVIRQKFQNQDDHQLLAYI